MKHKRTLVMMVVIVLVLAMAGPAMSRGASRWQWWKNGAIITRLNLSTEEIKKLDDAFIESRRNMLEIKGRVDAERFELEELLSRPEFDAATIRKQNRKMESARSELAAQRFEFLLKSREVLGHERFQKLTEIQRHWREKRRERMGQTREDQQLQGN